MLLMLHFSTLFDVLQAHARLKGLVEHADANFGATVKALARMETLRDAALMRTMRVATRDVAVTKQTPTGPIGATIETAHTREFRVPVVIASEPWQHNLMIGDAVLGINGETTLTWSHKKVADTLKAASGIIKLTVCVAGELFAAVAGLHALGDTLDL